MRSTLSDVIPSILIEMMTEAGMVRPYHGSDRLTVDDSMIYGRTTADMRALMHGVVLTAQNRADSDPWIGRAGNRAGEWGRVSYGYAGGWYDAIKRGRPSAWCTEMLAGMMEFSYEAEFAEFVFASELTGMRSGYGNAWETFMRARGLTD